MQWPLRRYAHGALLMMHTNFDDFKDYNIYAYSHETDAQQARLSMKFQYWYKK